ncbi:MAG: uracil-DNA glycosylase [Erysipelotrichaceae bacterium]
MNWDVILKAEAKQPYYQEMMKTLNQEYQNKVIYPPLDELFTCFKECPYDELKVVILGQDPYHQKGQAHGLAFSVKEGVKCPPSLRNIIQELSEDLKIDKPISSNLLAWAKQGVLLMNAIMSVEDSHPSSHKDIGWGIFTDHILMKLNEYEQPLVFILWGNFAIEKAKFLNNPNHLILKSAHPSPLSAYRGFFHSHPFSQANAFLKGHGRNEINWKDSFMKKPFDNCKDAITFIEKRRNRNHGVLPLKKLMNELGDPQRDIPCIHVGGTNGKGSTLNYIRSILQCAGYRVATFTSPYLIHHQDRIRINDEDIKEEALLNLINEYYDKFIEYDLGMFEIDMLIASLYFKQEKVDYAIYEVGIGGRLDPTNLVYPLCSVVTNIGMDHMQLLGDTYPKIAFEKAGIIKEGIPFISAEKKNECLEVFDQGCLLNHTKRIELDEVKNIRKKDTIVFDYGDLKNINLNTLAYYQIDNAICAIEVIRVINNNLLEKISDDIIKRGLKDTFWKGRFEIMSQDPCVIIDGAHNPEGMQALLQSMDSFKNIHVIFSVLKDKSYEAMIQDLCAISDDVTVCDFENERSLNGELLASHHHVSVDHNYIHAIDVGLKKEGTLLITGSLLFISMVREYFMNI